MTIFGERRRDSMFKRSKAKAVKSKGDGLVSHALLEITDVPDGSLDVSLVEASPGSCELFHSNERDRTYVVISGRAWARAGNEGVGVSEGDLCHVPAGLPHGIANASDRETLVYLAVAAPNVGEIVS